MVRPFGAIVFGHIGDLIGRKFTFMLTLALMGAATFVVGCLPGYDSIGWTAPFLLVMCRVVQGLALGGEYGGAATYVAEHAPDGKRGFYTSWIQTTATMGIVIALLVIIAFRVGMGEAAFQAYGWRFPFLLSAILVMLSGYIRLRLEESPLFHRLKTQGKSSDNPALESFGSGKNWGLILIALFGFTAPEGVVWYTGQFYALTYMIAVLKIPFLTVYLILTFALLLGAPFFIVFGMAVRPDRPQGHHDRRLRAGGDHLLAGVHLAGRLEGQSGHPVHPGVLHGDPGHHGVRPDRRVPGGTVPGAHPLHLDVAALSRRQRRVRRRRAVHRNLAVDA